MVGQAVTVPATIGARSHILIGAGEVPPVAGVIHRENQTGLTPSYLGRGLFSDVGGRAPQNISEIIQCDGLAIPGVLWVVILRIIRFAGVALS
jgi:hypothetical protein